ncbi:meprin A subunit beta isoform X5 [Vidua chalybeata]|uniref:meprin A subunit beta isoform X5 n=1 Tax=Vidua chalybeata TaxID=81927 RepID=UPI0023A81F13|nr:meprin A subunit beta isoform X5 [Vidua chalybeata]
MLHLLLLLSVFSKNPGVDAWLNVSYLHTKLQLKRRQSLKNRQTRQGHTTAEGQYNVAKPAPETTEIDVDGGIDQDIFNINEALGLDLFEGDIKLPGERNSIIGDNYRWPHVIPYVLEDSLEMNAKGVILKAFEQYRLKTCIDFKPWEGEKNYISVFKGSGCWSSVGNMQIGLQQLSIGTNCDRIGTIQHEFLHALGFWHEQSRSDRDDYVTIVWDRIQSGKGHNFNKYNDKTSDFLNVPYDYNSVMHYSKTAFRNGTEPTIITNIPDFTDVIGQRMDFSEYDLQKLNRLYNCTFSLSFMDTCSFELENICGMIQSSDDNSDWQRLSQVPAGPNTDHTNMGECKDSGYFMHFDTSAGGEGSTAVLESRILYPKRGIYLSLISGANDDQLKWPCPWQQGTMILLDQHPDIRQQMSNQRSVTTDPLKLSESSSNYIWDRPDKVGSKATFPNGTKYMRGPGVGTSTFLTHERLRSRNFIKEDGIYILLTMEDISHLLSTQPSTPAPLATTTSASATKPGPSLAATTKPPSGTETTTTPSTTTTTMGSTTQPGDPEVPAFCSDNPCENDGVCVMVNRAPVCRCPAGDNWWYMGEKCERKGSTQENIVIAVSSTITVFVVMLIVTITIAVCLKKKYKQRKDNKESVTLEETKTSF